MTIKYFKYAKSTLPGIKPGMIEVYVDSIDKNLLLPFIGLKVGIGIIPSFQSSLDQYRYQRSEGIYQMVSNTIWVLNNKNIITSLRHELIHACQAASTEAALEISKVAQAYPNWEAIERSVASLYQPQAWSWEVPAWVLQADSSACNYFINKYLK